MRRKPLKDGILRDKVALKIMRHLWRNGGKAGVSLKSLKGLKSEVRHLRGGRSLRSFYKRLDILRDTGFVKKMKRGRYGPGSLAPGARQTLKDLARLNLASFGDDEMHVERPLSVWPSMTWDAEGKPEIYPIPIDVAYFAHTDRPLETGHLPLARALKQLERIFESLERATDGRGWSIMFSRYGKEPRVRVWDYPIVALRDYLEAVFPSSGETDYLKFASDSEWEATLSRKVSLQHAIEALRWSVGHEGQEERRMHRLPHEGGTELLRHLEHLVLHAVLGGVGEVEANWQCGGFPTSF